MNIFNFNYSIKIERKPKIKKLTKEIRKVFSKHGKGDYEFSIQGNNIICDKLLRQVRSMREEHLNNDIIKIGNKYGYHHLSFPYWYYSK